MMDHKSIVEVGSVAALVFVLSLTAVMLLLAIWLFRVIICLH